MSLIPYLFLFAIITGIIIGLISIVRSSTDKRKNISEQPSSTINPTASKEFTIREENYTDVAPNAISIPENSNCHESVAGGIGFLNYRTYSFSAKYIETNRMRKRYIDVFDNCDVKKEIMSLGYSTPITYEVVSPEAATEPQLDYINGLIEDTGCEIDIPLDKLSKTDASGLIYYMTEGGHTPSQDIINYASDLKLEISYCFPDWLIFHNIFNSMPLKDKIFFFIFCVHRDEYVTIYENPNHSPAKDVFTKFADIYEKDAKFLESFQKYYTNGHQLIRFGQTITREYPIKGGSKQSFAYKTAIEFLKNNL